MTTKALPILCAALTLVLVGPARAASLTEVPHPNPKMPGFSEPNALPPELVNAVVAQGSVRVENPSSFTLPDGGVVNTSYYGYQDNGPFLPLPGTNVEAQKTEPDKNTYLVLEHQKGADPSYDYGNHFIFQGHEVSISGASYITRVNLDADIDHRVTIMASTLVDGRPVPNIDGSTWNPFAGRLLFTSEGGASGGVYQATLDYPSRVEDMAGVFGRGGYEGIQTDGQGNTWIVEDSGGANGTVNNFAKAPNSFIYRFVPQHRSDLSKGKLQVLQVISLRTGLPIVFHPGAADADILSDDTKDLNTYGKVFDTKWVTIHDTAVDGTAAYNANALAKTKGGTPFKRPENGQFRPGSDFSEFYFTATGDTDARTQAGSAFGGFGGIYQLSQRCSDDSGKLRLFYQGNLQHTGFDNIAFWDKSHLVVVEDRGDTLHTQGNALDQMWLLDVRKNFADPKNQPKRIMAEGRDASATIDSSLLGSPGFQNEGDNEITGIHVSNGDPGPRGLLGASLPTPFRNGWRVFWTQQHGDNVLWEILPTNPDAWQRGGWGGGDPDDD